jgi:Zn finger protein HypA/HybF involved in hydrogenase expression
MASEEKAYRCERCGRSITNEEYELYDGLCEECCEIEIDELDYEDDYG